MILLEPECTDIRSLPTEKIATASSGHTGQRSQLQVRAAAKAASITAAACKRMTPLPGRITDVAKLSMQPLYRPAGAKPELVSKKSPPTLKLLEVPADLIHQQQRGARVQRAPLKSNHPPRPTTDSSFPGVSCGLNWLSGQLQLSSASGRPHSNIRPLSGRNIRPILGECLTVRSRRLGCASRLQPRAGRADGNACAAGRSQGATGLGSVASALSGGSGMAA